MNTLKSEEVDAKTSLDLDDARQSGAQAGEQTFDAYHRALSASLYFSASQSSSAAHCSAVR
jgi:hypothetical protein